MKITEIFTEKDNILSVKMRVFEAKNLYWFNPNDMIPAQWIYEEREIYLRQEYIDDNYVGKEGAIFWWNSKLVYKVRENLLEKYPHKEPIKLITPPKVFKHKNGEMAFEFKRASVYASQEEREKFYSSLDWSYVKYLRFCIDKGICQRCEEKPQIPEINHLYPIASEKYPNLFIRNIDVDRVETLCSSCHKTFHETHVNTGYEFV